MAIRIRATDKQTGATKVLSQDDSIKIGKIIINTEISRECFLEGINFEYKGLSFCREDIN